MKNLTELIFILDRSGSMAGLETETINGFNSMIDRLKDEERETRVTTILFDNEYEVLHDGIDIFDVKTLSAEEYYVRGMTALLDAVGQSIQNMIRIKKRIDPKKKKEKVIVVITTDGYENASKIYSVDEIKGMIEHQQSKYGWEFMFLGANIDSVSEGKKMGIPMDRSSNFRYDEKGVVSSYLAMSRFISSVRENDKRIDDSWKEEIID